MFLNPQVLLIGVFAFVTLKYIIIPAYKSPLNKVPAASPFSIITSLWISWKRYRGKEFQTVEAAFRKHGPVVRLSPQELAVNSMDCGIKTVYGRGYHKPSWYDQFINYGRRNIISTLDEMHGKVRRRISSVYAKSFLQGSQHFRTMASTIVENRLIPLITRHYNSETSIDALELSLAYGLDMVTATIFGLSRSTNLLQDNEGRNEFLDTMLDPARDSYYVWLTDFWDMTCWLQKLGLNPIPKSHYSSKQRREAWCLKLVDSVEEMLVSHVLGKSMALGDEPIVYLKLRGAIEEESKRDQGSKNAVPLSSPAERRMEIASECLDHITATRDDFGITLASVFYQISLHSDCQSRLRLELLSVSTSGLPTPQDLESLPYFNAVIKECLRLRPNPPTPNPRQTPPGAPSTIGPYHDVPPNTKIVAFSRCLHRNEKIFPRPSDFVPERWLRPTQVMAEDDREQMARVDEREEWFWAFGSGSRMCLASNLATELIRMALAAVYTRFSTVVEDATRFGKNGDFVTGSPDEKLLLKVIAADT